MESRRKESKNSFLQSSLLSKHTSKSLSKRLKLYHNATGTAGSDEDEEDDSPNHHFSSLLSSMNSTSNSNHTTNIETLLPKIIAHSKGYLWKSYDILYYLPILIPTSLKSTAGYEKPTSRSGYKSNQKNNNNVSNNYEFYLMIFYSKENSSGYVVILRLAIGSKEIDFLFYYNLMDIKNIKYGNETNEFLLTISEDMHHFKTLNNIDRDEIIWILIHVCQYLCEHNIKSKNFEIKHLYAAITTKETLTRFPLLRDLLKENMDDDDLLDPFSGNGDSMLSFTPEESDAEKLFDEFQWGNSTSIDGNADPSILQKKLKNESDSLHIEICDFLLQWEDDELIDHSIAMGALKSLQERQKSSLSPSLSADGNRNSSRETLEMLTILTQVDQELQVVDDWLTKQITYLSTVQKELFQIEAENSTLETSWHNLSAVKTMITSLLNGPLSLASDHEVDLRNPAPIVRNALEDKELKNTGNILLRLVNALESLRNGLQLIEGNDPSFAPAQWEKLQSMSVISHQRNKLIELSEIVCSSLVDLVGNIFTTILHHKAVTDPSLPKNRTILVRKFSFSSVTNRVKEQQGRYLVVNEDDEGKVEDHSSGEIGSVSYGSPTVAYGAVTNQLLNAQQVYHNTILPFIPLLENLAALSPTLSQLLCASYVDATEAGLYSPLTKDMFRELFASIPSRSNPVFTLASAPRSLAKKMTNPTLRFQHPSMCRSGSPLIVSPWTVFAISIKLIEEVASQEKIFLTQVIKKLNTVKKSANADQDYLASVLGKLFEQFREKVLRLVTSAEYSDGVEIIPMLITAEMLLGGHHSTMTTTPTPTTSSTSATVATPLPSTSSTSKSQNDDEKLTPIQNKYEVDIVGSLLGACKSILQDRLNEFVNAQISWINQCREDPKKSIVLLPFAKFPAFIDQLKELSGDKRFDCVDDTLQRIGRELMVWLHLIASQNEKYKNVVLIQNLEFLIESLSIRDDVAILKRLSSQAIEQKSEAERQYVEWMIAYEFPSYTQLADRVKELGKRATSEEMGLYIRREEVSRAVSKMDKKTVETSVMNLKKRLEKHYHGYPEASGLNIIPRLWRLIQGELSKVFSVIENVATSSYQITLMVDAKTVELLCQQVQV